MANPDRQFEEQPTFGKHTEWVYGIMLFLVFIVPIIVIAYYYLNTDKEQVDTTKTKDGNCYYSADEYICE